MPPNSSTRVISHSEASQPLSYRKISRGSAFFWQSFGLIPLDCIEFIGKFYLRLLRWMNF